MINIVMKAEEQFTTNYCIIGTVWHFGQTYIPCKKEDVRRLCEVQKSLYSRIDNKENQHRIEVLNCETGEIREYWNDQDNTIKF